MKAQLGLFFVFLTITTVLAQISFALPDPSPDVHERNRCRPPNCHGHRREPGDRGKKIPDEDGKPVDENTLTDEIKDDNGTASSSTEGKLQIVSQIVITPGPDGQGQNGTDASTATSESTQFIIPSLVESNGSSTEGPSPSGETITEEIRIPVEVKIIPPSRDELGGLEGHCPKPFRYHNETGMCFIPGQGDHPCGADTLMEFYEQPGTEAYGRCDCKPFSGCDFRPLVFHADTKRCYHLFDQGPCKSDEWLTLGQKTYEPTCTNRPCPPNNPAAANQTWFVFDGKCHQLGTQAFCANPMEIAQYDKGTLVPGCYFNPLKALNCLAGEGKTITLGSGSLPCPPGQQSTGSGSCGKVVGF